MESKYVLFDDLFMRLCLNERIDVLSLIVSILLKRDIIISKVIGQSDFVHKKEHGRNLKLDFEILDTFGNRYNVEIQKNMKGADIKRAVYHEYVLGMKSLKKTQDFSQMKNRCVIMICSKDYFNEGQPVYWICRTRSHRPVDDGAAIVYVNGEYRGNDAIGKLMHDFSCHDTNQMYYKEIAQCIEEALERGGNDRMSEMADQWIEEGEAEGIEEGEIKGTIKTLLKLNKTEAEICEYMNTDYHLSNEETHEYMLHIQEEQSNYLVKEETHNE